jgi:hypothetical protein
MRRRFLLRIGFVVATALAATSCLSPTLPLPPPDVDSSTEAADGQHWILSGTCRPGALVTVLNEETGLGSVYEDRGENGQWTIELEAQKCDRAWVAQQYGNDGSGRNEIVIEPINGGDPAGTCK